MRPTQAGDGEASARRAEILIIAAREFASSGYSGTSMRQIADQAGILAGSLYHHFPSKEAIFEEILRDLIVDSVSRYEAAVAVGGGPLAVMDRLVRHALSIIDERRDQVIVYQNERAFFRDNPKHAFVLEGSARMEAIWLEQLEEGKRIGAIRADIDSPVMARFIRDAIWSSVRWFTPGGPEFLELLCAQFTMFLHVGIVAQEAPSPAP